MIEWDERTLLIGQRLVFKGTHLDDDGEPEGITGREFGLWIYPEGAPEDAVEYGNAVFTITDAAAGTWEAVVPRADTQVYVAGRYIAEVWFTDDDDAIAWGPLLFVETGRTDD